MSSPSSSALSQGYDELLTDIRAGREYASTVLSVSSIALTHFRCYESARLETRVSPIVLYGRNGAGKTNILEALSLLTPGRGLRRATLSEMDNLAHQSPWTIVANAQGLHGLRATPAAAPTSGW
jgi:hypothetical protein